MRPSAWIRATLWLATMPSHNIEIFVASGNFHDYMYTDEILRLGVDEVYCISVNDAFVMRQVSTFSVSMYLSSTYHQYHCKHVCVL